MSDTKKHKDQGKFHSGVLDSTEVCESTKQMWNRHNGDRGELRKVKKELVDKIAEKELKIELKELIEEGVDSDNPIQEEILIQIMGRE